MLVIGLLAGFGGGFVAGQRMAPPPPPRVVEVPRPAPAVIPAPAPPVVPAPLDTARGALSDSRRAQDFTEAPVVEARPVEVREPAEPVARRPGILQLDSRPSAATVYVDEVRVGVTPMTMRNVTPGAHQVRIELLGHQTWRTSVNVEAGAEVRVGASLE